MKIAIIGAGNMGGAIVRGLCQNNNNRYNISVSNPSQEKLDSLKQGYNDINITNDNVEASQDADIIILAVKPWLIAQVIDEIAPNENQIVVSVAAGIELAQLNSLLGNQGNTIFRVIPNTAISVNASMTLISSYNAKDEQEQLLLDLFAPMGMTMLIAEQQMSAATSMTSCGIAYALKYIQAGMQAGTELGINPKEGMKMVAQTLKGAAELILQNDTHPTVEIDKVCTPGGYTIKGINTLDTHGYTTAIIEAIKASLP